MALFDTALTPRPSLLSRLSRLLETPFDQRSRAIAERAAYLRSLSDADLAALGLTRDTILPHVFKRQTAR
ncbi:hypothetical protein [Pacificoceanicola onchidii]|uniref:hypothetical protein n=1 Tax=Pacificoceanicola onchidii TaxID=2562685 RepID=UPI0010A3C286|nr:hypothetical protein [Pacificoceanicola onchidii]